MADWYANQHIRNGVKKFTARERFLNKVKVNPETDCWEWMGFRNKQGYGHFAESKEIGNKLSHRFSYELYIGEIPKGLLVCHKCDNPSCVSPFHFFLGTDLDNLRDAQNKGHKPRAKHPSSMTYKRGCRCELCRRFKNYMIQLNKLKQKGILGERVDQLQREVKYLKDNATLIEL